MLKDKDILKNEVYHKYSAKVGILFLVPMTLQLWQITLVNNFERAALYQRVRVLKALTFWAALGLSVHEMWNVEKQWKYYDRFYPEATELQKSLFREAMMFKET